MMNHSNALFEICLIVVVHILLSEDLPLGQLPLDEIMLLFSRQQMLKEN
jgi:hypothetical protein